MDQIYKLIKLNKFVTSHRIKFASALVAHRLKLRHLFVRFDPVMACNLRCTMCYFSNDDHVKQIKGQFTESEIDRIAKLFFLRTLQLVIGCGTEPTLYRNFPELVSLTKKYKIPFVGFTTNGQLLTQAHIEQLTRNKLDELTISVHGVYQETYERFMAKASYQKLHEVLTLIDQVKKEFSSPHPHLRINYTVNADNLAELRDFYEVFGQYNIRTLQIRPIIDFEGAYRTLLTQEEIPSYNLVIGQLIEECRKRNVTCLVNTEDPSYKKTNITSVILQAVRRHITPQVVWQSDFDWRNETYDEYCKRIDWSRHLRHLIFSNIEEVRTYNAGLWGRHAAKYEVL